MNNRRLNVRFNLDNPDEKSANDYLEALAQNNKQSRNRFIVEAVIEKIKSINNPRSFTLEDIRAVLREELQDISFVSSAQPSLQTVDTELTEEQQEKNDAEALSFLENFMCAKSMDFWLKTVKSQNFMSHFGSLILNQKGIF